LFYLCWLPTFLLAPSAWSATATAVLKGTAPDSKITGNVTLVEEKGGLTVTAHVSNVPPGTHGFHIHAIGNCGDMEKPQAGILILINLRMVCILWMVL